VRKPSAGRRPRAGLFSPQTPDRSRLDDPDALHWQHFRLHCAFRASWRHNGLRQRFATVAAPFAVARIPTAVPTTVTRAPLPVAFATFFALLPFVLTFAYLPAMIDLLLFRRDSVRCDEVFDGRNALQLTPRAVMKPTEHDPKPERRVLADPGNPDHVQGRCQHDSDDQITVRVGPDGKAVARDRPAVTLRELDQVTCTLRVLGPALLREDADPAVRRDPDFPVLVSRSRLRWHVGHPSYPRPARRSFLIAYLLLRP